MDITKLTPRHALNLLNFDKTALILQNVIAFLAYSGYRTRRLSRKGTYGCTLLTKIWKVIIKLMTMAHSTSVQSD